MEIKLPGYGSRAGDVTRDPTKKMQRRDREVDDCEALLKFRAVIRNARIFALFFQKTKNL
jgi:hypothetical protein